MERLSVGLLEGGDRRSRRRGGGPTVGPTRGRLMDEIKDLVA